MAVETFKGTVPVHDTVEPVVYRPAGWGDWTPKGMIFWATSVTDELANPNVADMHGFSDAVNDVVCVQVRGDGLTGTGGRQLETACILILDNGSPTYLAEATVASMDVGGFTLDWSNVDVTSDDIVVHYFAFGGDDVEAAVNSIAGSSSPETGLAFEPDLLFAISIGGIAEIGTARNAFGVSNGLDEWWVASQITDTVEDSVLRTGAFVGQMSGTISWELSDAVFTSDGFSWSGTNGDTFHYLALKLGTGIDVGTFTKAISTSVPVSQNMPDLGFVPQSYLTATASCLDEVGSTDQGVAVAYGGFDGTNQGITLFTTDNASNDNNERQNNENAFATSTGQSSAALDSAAIAQPIVDSTPELSWTSNTADAFILGYVAFEVNPAPPPPPEPVDATLLGRLQSVVRVTTASTAGPASLALVTVNHLLGASPDKIIPVLRSVVSMPSQGSPVLSVRSWDATVAILDLEPGTGTGDSEAQFDVLFEVTDSLVK